MTRCHDHSRPDLLFTKTLRCRVKGKYAKTLLAQSKEVNFVWSFVNELSDKHTRRTGKFISTYDLNQDATGATKAGLSLHSQTVQAINEEFATRRIQFRKLRLCWRKSGGSRRSLGWIPIKKSAITYRNGQLHYQGYAISLWDSYGLADYELGSGTFSEDSRGRWYFNTMVKVEKKPNTATKSIGIDLGLKECAVASDGQRLLGSNYRKLESKLGIAQRANKQLEVKNLHAKIKNRRKDELHKFSTMLTQHYGAIFVENVSSSKLIKTKMTKSTLDAGWSSLKTMLEYKWLAKDGPPIILTHQKCGHDFTPLVMCDFCKNEFHAKDMHYDTMYKDPKESVKKY